MVTKIFQFGPGEAEIIRFKVGWGLKSISGPRYWVDLFKPNYLSFPWSKLEYLGDHHIENFLNFSKLTQLLSVGEFIRSLGP